MRRNALLFILVTLSAALSVTGAAAQNTVPEQFQGTWVPSNATCESPVRVLIASNRLSLVNGKDSVPLGGIEMAGPGYFPPGYRGIMAVLLTEFSGDQPAIVTFNVGEKKGAAQVEFSPVQPGATTAQGKAYNAHISRLNLAKRFPLNKVLLKKCSGGSGGAPAAPGNLSSLRSTRSVMRSKRATAATGYPAA